MIKKIQVLLFTLATLFSIQLWADTNKDRTLEEKMIDTNIAIAEWFDGIAEGIDLFFIGRKITNRPNESAIKLSQGAYMVDREPFRTSTSIGASMRFPNIEQYWNLKFTSYDDTQERGVRKTQIRPEPRSQNPGATVGIFQKLGNVRTSFQPRIGLQDPLDVSHSLQFESLADQNGYTINPKLEFFANPSQGTGIFNAINFYFNITDIWSFTLINEGEYQDKLHLYKVTNGFACGQVITGRSNISYGVYFGSRNQPSYHLYDYALAITWSHLLYKKMLDYSITPNLLFEKEKSFTGVPGLAFVLNLTF